MRPVFALTLAALALALPAVAAPAITPSPAAPTPLGADALWAWSWDSSEALVRATTDNGFSRVYLYAQGGFDARTRQAIAALTANGIEVEALWR